MGVNLERAMMTNGRLGGHFIQGHVDGIAPITSILKKGESALLTVQIPEQLRQYVAVKGSIAINGISLTVANVSQDLLTVAIIPLTFQETTLYTKKKGDFVNLEVDILAKYVLNFLTKGSQQKNNLLNKLHEWGYENNKGNHEF
jgi:riboflavin synthase